MEKSRRDPVREKLPFIRQEILRPFPVQMLLFQEWRCIPEKMILELLPESIPDMDGITAPDRAQRGHNVLIVSLICRQDFLFFHRSLKIIQFDIL
jgi:hypothetical protein